MEGGREGEEPAQNSQPAFLGCCCPAAPETTQPLPLQHPSLLLTSGKDHPRGMGFFLPKFSVRYQLFFKEITVGAFLAH